MVFAGIYPIENEHFEDLRDSLEKLRSLPLVTTTGAQIPLGQIAEVKIVDGPPMLKSENGRLNGWTFVDIRDADLGSYVATAQQAVREQVDLPAGYSITWSGQYEYMQRANQRLSVVVPLTLAIAAAVPAASMASSTARRSASRPSRV